MFTESIPKRTKHGTVNIPERLKAFNDTQYFAVLATNDAGHPYTSLISFAITPDMKKIIFATPKQTQKFRNIVKTKDISILIDNRSRVRSNLMATEAITIIGKAKYIRKSEYREELAKIFLKKHQMLEEFLHSDTTALIVVNLTRCIHVCKFQSVSVWEVEHS